MASGTLRKIWHFIWKEDSIWSWIVNIIIAFILVKFIVYPGLGALLDTNYPVVAVVSGSMDHKGSFDDWWSRSGDWYVNNGISKDMFESYIFKNGFNKGDVMVLKGVDIKDIKVGDVIVFNGRSSNPIIHRVVKIHKEDGLFVQTKGDANSGSSSGLGEDKISKDKIIGRAVFRIPLIGWVKILFVDILRGI